LFCFDEIDEIQVSSYFADLLPTCSNTYWVRVMKSQIIVVSLPTSFCNSVNFCLMYFESVIGCINIWHYASSWLIDPFIIMKLLYLLMVAHSVPSIHLRLYSLVLSPQPPCKLDGIIISILQVKKLRHRNVNLLKIT
jgi:hypothetical protein